MGEEAILFFKRSQISGYFTLGSYHSIPNYRELHTGLCKELSHNVRKLKFIQVRSLVKYLHLIKHI